MDHKTLFGRMLKAFATSADADPDEVAEAAKMGDREKDEEPEEKKKVTAEDRMSRLEDSFNQFLATYAADKKAKDEAEAEIESKKEEIEEAVEGLIEAVEEEHEEGAEDGAVRDSAGETLIHLRSLKPLVAKSGDKTAIDAYNQTLRALKGGKKSGHDGYKALSKAVALRSADAEAAMVEAKAAELVAYKAMLDAAGEKAVAGYRR